MSRYFVSNGTQGMLSEVNGDFIDELLADWLRQRPDLDSTALGVVLRIQALEKILGDRAAERLMEFGLHWWQYDVLSALRRQGKPFELAAAELAEAGMRSSGAVTNRIDRLEADGLVRRLQDPDDRRRVLVRLTPRGRELVDRVTAARFEAAQAALAGLAAKDRRRLDALLRNLLLAQDA